MSLAIIHSRASLGLDAPPIRVEVHVAGGLPGISIIGLPEAAVREAKDRVRAALQNSGFKIPPRRITVNLAPADIPKTGSRFDLAIAIGILAASGQLQGEWENFEFIGELSLSGQLRSIPGTLAAALRNKDQHRQLILPLSNAAEAALAESENNKCAEHLLDVCQHIAGQKELIPASLDQARSQQHHPDIAEVCGQEQAKRALEIAACGQHSLLMYGPPGSGKSMLAQRLPSLLPPLSLEQKLQTAVIRSVCQNESVADNWGKIPWRNPHHSASAAALAGGGSPPQPGEISLAHHGVLFLDELPEFKRNVIEILREPLETGKILISRARYRNEFPARFQLIAAMNPCPCGFLGEAQGRCRCTADQIQRYRNRISGPLLDRMDMLIHVPRVPTKALLNSDKTRETSADVQLRVLAARDRQLKRSGCSNAQLDNRQLQQHCKLSHQGQSLLQRLIEQMDLSARATHRLLKLARSIADLADQADIDVKHLAEAAQYRMGRDYEIAA